MSGAVFELVKAEIMEDDRRRPRRESIRLVSERYMGLSHSGSLLSRARSADRRGVVAVEFENYAGDRYLALWGVDRYNGAWQIAGGASCRAPGVSPAKGWISGGGWGSGGTGVSTGLWITHPEARVARIVDPHGNLMEDGVRNGVALFMWEGQDFNLYTSTVELLDSAGHVLTSGPLHRAKWEPAET